MKKHTYEQPLAETFELSIQNTILDGSPNDGYNSSNHTQYITGGTDDNYEAL